MKTLRSAFGRTVLVLALFSLSGCATYWAERRADRLATQGQPAEAVKILEGLAGENPTRYRLKYIHARDEITRDLIRKAQEARRQGQTDVALGFFREVLKYDVQHADARQGLEVIARDRRESDLLARAQAASDAGKKEVAKYLLNEILVANPQHGGARELKKAIDIEDNRLHLEEPALVESLAKPISLEFRNASLQAILEVLSQSSGLDFIFDKEVKADLRTTIFARDTTVADALGVILRTNQLSAKTLNASTLLIYPAVPEKEKQYEDLVVRTFYLGSADPKRAQEMIRTIVAPKAMYVDDKLRALVIRDNLNVIEAVERLLAAYDIAPPEVVLEVEIFEVSKDSLLNVGLQFPDRVSASISGSAGTPGKLTLEEAENIERENFQLLFPDPVAVLNLRQTSGKANTLANPRIRVKSQEKAKVLIGDKVPVITTTTNQTSSATTESVTYLDVGLKLEVEPEIHVNNEVSINVALEVSNIIKEIKSTTGLLTYQIGTRSANTVLRLRDGETQALAGLIKDEQRDSASHLPGLGKLPLIGRLFSNETNNHSKSEIVLLITPRVVRSLATPDAHVVEFISGTSTRPSTEGFRLNGAGRVSAANRKLPATGAAAAVVTPAVNAKPGEPAQAVPVPVVVAPAADEAAAPGKPLALDFVIPAKIQAGQAFTVPIMLGGQALEDLQFDLAFDAPVLKLVKVTPVANVQGMEAEQVGGGIHVSIKGVAAHSGPVAVLSLQAEQHLKEAVKLTLKNASGRLPGSSAALINVVAERQLQIVP